MIKLLILLCYMFILPSAMGYIFSRCLGNGKESSINFLWKGIVIELFSFGILCNLVVVLNGDFQNICGIFSKIGIFIIIVAIMIWRIDRPWKKKNNVLRVLITDKKAILYVGIFCALFLMQIVKSGDVISQYPGDHMGVYVSTVTSENSLFMVNPVTGFEYVNKRNMRYTELTIFYSFLVSVSNVNNLTLLYKVVPVWILGIFYNIQYSLGKEFFHKDIKKVLLYCIGVALIVIWGTGKGWMLPSYLLCTSWTDEAMQICILMPLIVWMIIQIIYQNHRKDSVAFLFILCWIFAFGDIRANWMLGGLGLVVVILYGLKKIGV